MSNQNREQNHVYFHTTFGNLMLKREPQVDQHEVPKIVFLAVFDVF